mgnify:FL=1
MNKTTSWIIWGILGVAGLATGLTSILNNPSPKLAFVTQSTFDCSQVTDVPVSKCEALVALYDSTNGDNWINNTNWKETTTVCNWFGVVCKNGRVEKLNLYTNQLSGPIPTSIGNLTNLTQLNLHTNQLSGPIPTSIGNFTNLKTLDLSYNQLSGPIPTSIGNLTNLQWLYLLKNQLSGPIPKSIGNLTNLKSLELRFNQLCGKIPEWIMNLSIWGSSGSNTIITNNNLIKEWYSSEFITWINNLGGFGYQDPKECGETPKKYKVCTDYQCAWSNTNSDGAICDNAPLEAECKKPNDPPHGKYKVCTDYQCAWSDTNTDGKICDSAPVGAECKPAK